MLTEACGEVCTVQLTGLMQSFLASLALLLLLLEAVPAFPLLTLLCGTLSITYT